MRGSRAASVPAVVLAGAIVCALVAYSVPFIRDRSAGPMLLPKGTVLTLGVDLPPLNVSFWVFADGTRIVGQWVSDQPGLIFVTEYGLSPFRMLIPHGVLDRCGGSMDAPLGRGQYTMTFVPGSPNVTRVTVVEAFALVPATGAPPAGRLLACPAPAP